MIPISIGIDLGTSSVKSVLVDDNCNLIKESKVEYEFDSFNNGYCEMNPEVWYESTIKSLKILLKNIDTKTIKTIGITGQMHTSVYLDKDKYVIRPSILWNDKRTAKDVDEIKEQLTEVDPNHRSLKILSTGSPASNLYWLRENERDNFDKISYLLTPKDYLVLRLTGVYSTDYCDASTSSIYDFDKNDWDLIMMEILGINFNLPKIFPCNQVIGAIESCVAEDLNLANVSVVAGTGDNPAAYYSNYIISGKIPQISLGTSGVMVLPTERLIDYKYFKNIVLKFVNESMYLVQGTVQSSGSSIDWFNKLILEDKNFISNCETIDYNLISNNTCYFIPYMKGDKTLYANPSMEGAFIGLNLETTQDKMRLAVMEGISFALRTIKENYESLGFKIDKLQVIGGGSNSQIWRRVLANILDCDIMVSKHTTSASLGVAIMAMSEFINVREELDIYKYDYIIEKPNTNMVNNYNKKYETFLNYVNKIERESK